VQIILVSSRFRTAKTITLRPSHLLAAGGLFLLTVLFGSACLSWLSIHWRLPIVQDLVHSMQQREAAEAGRFVQENLQAMAARLGELQAQMVQLDGLGQRLDEKAGLLGNKARPAGGRVPAEPQGGPFVPAPLDAASLDSEMEQLAARMESRAVSLSALEARLRERQLRRESLPTTLPVAGGAHLGSPFGVRSDPFGRGRAIHEGLDFVAPPGTSILAAADGVVVNAAYHPEFGNLVEISHGGELITRYAHLASMVVEVGNSVRRGQKIGTLGTTGRSTGPHLHFEVKANGAAIDPAGFFGSQLARAH
jgi:murein DD-endopeptidase MepM/ murein hydrolase activator NlpD